MPIKMMDHPSFRLLVQSHHFLATLEAWQKVGDDKRLHLKELRIPTTNIVVLPLLLKQPNQNHPRHPIHLLEVSPNKLMKKRVIQTSTQLKVSSISWKMVTAQQQTINVEI